MIIIANIFTGRFRGITLFPFIILKDKYLKLNSVLVNHEKIHLTQQSEMYVLPFYLFYVVEFLIKKMYYKDAYMNISFEREAYDNQSNMDYLKKRKKYSWIKYL